MGGMGNNIKKRIDEEYIRSIQFTTDLVDVLKERFGSEISDIANSIASEDVHRHWTKIAQQEESNMISVITFILWKIEYCAAVIWGSELSNLIHQISDFRIPSGA